ncbi:unnamed protein product [Closterium sp. NIES-54]
MAFNAVDATAFVVLPLILLEIQSCRLPSDPPLSLSHSPSLRSDLEFNNLSESIPDAISHMTTLTSLYLSNNTLSGAIPPAIGALTSLQMLYLSNNQLSGAIPPAIGALKGLVHLMLENNQLSGAIPPDISSLTALQIFRLSNNQLSGAIPPAIRKMSYLSHNMLSDTIPSQMGSLPFLHYLHLDYNNLGGTIPNALSTLTSLISLSVARPLPRPHITTVHLVIALPTSLSLHRSPYIALPTSFSLHCSPSCNHACIARVNRLASFFHPSIASLKQELTSVCAVRITLPLPQRTPNPSRLRISDSVSRL